MAGSKPTTSLLTLALAVSLALGTDVSAQNFTLTIDRAIVYTPFAPNGVADIQQPYTMCRTYPITLRLKYVWRNSFVEQIYTEPVGTFYPQFFVQGVAPNPASMPVASVATPYTRFVDVGMITGPVNTAGIKTVSFRGRGTFDSSLIANASALIETQFEPSTTRYREVADGMLDMPLRPWFGWTGDLSATSYRLDVDACTSATAISRDECGGSNMAFEPLTTECGNSDYCWIGTPPSHQTATALLPNTPYEYRVLGRNNCGVSQEQLATPPRPFFRTAQACFTSGGSIPDGGTATFDAATLGLNPGSLVPNLRLTVHANHPQISDLRISLTKTSPVVYGPVLIMDRPTATIGASGSCDGPRLQAVFGDGGAYANAACKATEPTLSGKLGPVQALGSFAPAEGAGNWRLTVEDTVANGKAGSLVEWCLSADVPLRATTYVPPMILENGFESAP